jgi:hypothetical protein
MGADERTLSRSAGHNALANGAITNAKNFVIDAAPTSTTSHKYRAWGP